MRRVAASGFLAPLACSEGAALLLVLQPAQPTRPAPGAAASFPRLGRRKPPLAGGCGSQRPWDKKHLLLLPIVPAESTLIVLSKVGLQSLARGKLRAVFQQALSFPQLSAEQPQEGQADLRGGGEESILHPDPHSEGKLACPCKEQETHQTVTTQEITGRRAATFLDGSV